MVACIRLLNLFENMSRPKFLFSAEQNPRYLFFLLEAFNNIIQYQYEGNSRFIYAILRHANAFSRLAQLDISAWEALQKTKAANLEATEVKEAKEVKETEQINEEKANPGKAEKEESHSEETKVEEKPKAFVPTQEWVIC